MLRLGTRWRPPVVSSFKIIRTIVGNIPHKPWGGLVDGDVSVLNKSLLTKGQWQQFLKNSFQWECQHCQHPEMEVLYHIRPYFVGIFPYIAQPWKKNTLYMVGTSNQSVHFRHGNWSWVNIKIVPDLAMKPSPGGVLETPGVKQRFISTNTNLLGQFLAYLQTH